MTRSRKNNFTNILLSSLLLLLGLIFITCSASPIQSKNFIRKPQKLRIRNINSTAIRLTWREPKPNPDCPLQGYLVKIKAASPRLQSYRRRRFPEASLPVQRGAGETIRVIKIDASATQVIIGDLSPSQRREIRLVGVNCGGSEKATRWFEVKNSQEDDDDNDDMGDYEGDDADAVARDKKMVQRDVEAIDENYLIKSRSEPLGQPMNVRTKAASDSMFVSWGAPEGNAPVRGYMIGYGEGVPDVNWQYLEGHRRNVTIKNLKKQTQYVVSVRAFNDLEQGPVIYDLAYTHEKDDGPHAEYHFSSLPKPTKIKIKAMSPSSLRLQWFDESLGKQQLINDHRHYNVHYEESSSQNGKTMSIIVKDTSVILENLLPSTRYELKVRSVLGSQMSPFSESVSGKTLGVKTHESVYDNFEMSVRAKPGPRSKSNFDGRSDEPLQIGSGDNPDQSAENRLNLRTTDDAKPSKIKSQKQSEDGEPDKTSNNILDNVFKNETMGKRDSEATARRQATEPVVVEPPGNFFEEEKFGRKFRGEFKSIVKHSVQVFLTWPVYPNETDECLRHSDAATTSPSYVVRYRQSGDKDDKEDPDIFFETSILNSNLYALDSLKPNKVYEYQIKYLTANWHKSSPSFYFSTHL